MESRCVPVVRPPLHLHLILDPGPKHAGRSALPTSARPVQIPRRTGARPIRESKRGQHTPVPDHHHGKLELFRLTIPKNWRTRVQERGQKKKNYLSAVLFSQRGQRRGGVVDQVVTACSHASALTCGCTWLMASYYNNNPKLWKILHSPLIFTSLECGLFHSFTFKVSYLILSTL